MSAAVPDSPAAASAPHSSALRRRSRSAVARSAAGDRSLVVVVGLVLLALGTLVALLSFGVFGAGRAGRPLLDPVVVDALRAQPLLARLVAIGVGLLLVVLGLVHATRSLRPERRPDVVLDRGPETAIQVDARAAAEAVAGQAEGLPGVARARARVVGTDAAPAVRVTVRLLEDADVAEVCRLLDEEVLDGLRTSLGIPQLPVAVRLELDRTETARVA